MVLNLRISPTNKRIEATRVRSMIPMGSHTFYCIRCDYMRGVCTYHTMVSTEVHDSSLEAIGLSIDSLQITGKDNHGQMFRPPEKQTKELLWTSPSSGLLLA